MNHPQAKLDLPAGTAANVQAHLVRAAKVLANPTAAPSEQPIYETRRWSLYFFFRVMRQAELRETGHRLRELTQRAERSAADEQTGDASFLKSHVRSAASRVKLDFSFPSVLNGQLFEGAGTGRGRAADSAPPAQAFLHWLKVLIGRSDPGLLDQLMHTARRLATPAAPTDEPSSAFGDAAEPDRVLALIGDLAQDFARGDLKTTIGLIRQLPEMIAWLRTHYSEILSAVKESLDALPADGSPHGPLARMILYELLRQGAALIVSEPLQPLLRGEKDEEQRPHRAEPLDRTPISIAFTYPGLKGLGIDEVTLRSFPDAFRQGMAARAHRLGDIGPSAPENWEGELGLSSVHGFFTGGSGVDRERTLDARFWKELRADIRLFNDPSADRGSELRAWIGLMFRMLGLEILHIELGEDPYRVEVDGNVEHISPRTEHFGFRDGLSQPFVDLGLGDPQRGGGSPDRRGTWSPVARGEIFLDEEDETGHHHLFPIHADLRAGSTYLVFRKLEQDVQGFRTFLEQQRPNDSRAQRKLAAQFMGRWPSGTSLVHSPHADRTASGPESEAALNDFRYAADDPLGRKCPLGAHVRRANPRDIGERDNVRHHRILRRGIAYGGPLLPEGHADDGEKRGLLFIAANARIDLQFEVIQRDWLNGGEFLGQAGLGRCPISGANDGSSAATFLEAGATAPITDMPSFVTMRGGDYFFAPGLTALIGIAEGADFKVPAEDVPLRGFAMGDDETPSLFGEGRLKDYGRRTLGKGKPVRVTAAAGAARRETLAFVGRYNDVRKVLSNDPAPGRVCPAGAGGVAFSVEPYRTAGQRITRGETFLIGTDSAGPTSAARHRLFTVLDEAWDKLASQWASGIGVDVRMAATTRLDATLRRVAGARRIDLVDDLGVQASYGVLEKVFGVPGPSWLTELAAALPFARQHVGDLPRDWIAAFRGERPTDPGLTTMQVWNTVLVADLIANFQNQQPLQALARQAGSEMLNHIDLTLARIRGRGPLNNPKTLAEVFVFNEQQPPASIETCYQPFGPVWREVYYKDVAIILLETLGSTLAVVPLTFGSVMTSLLDLRIDLSLLLPRLLPGGVAQIVYEAERLRPNTGARVRRCEVDSAIGNGTIKKGDLAVALIAAANMDRHIFWKPERFSLGQFDPQADLLYRRGNAAGKKPRDPDNYLLFGVKHSNKDCWGRDRVAMPILEACVLAAGRLQGLRRVAGPGGEPQKMAGVTIGLGARFTRIMA